MLRFCLIRANILLWWDHSRLVIFLGRVFGLMDGQSFIVSRLKWFSRELSFLLILIDLTDLVIIQVFDLNFGEIVVSRRDDIDHRGLAWLLGGEITPSSVDVKTIRRFRWGLGFGIRCWVVMVVRWLWCFLKAVHCACIDAKRHSVFLSHLSQSRRLVNFTNILEHLGAFAFSCSTVYRVVLSWIIFSIFLTGTHEAIFVGGALPVSLRFAYILLFFIFLHMVK